MEYEDAGMNRVIVGLLIMLTCNYLQADDLTLPKDFKAGDVVSADTFNQVFRAIERVNRTVTDEDLVGVWSCSAIESSGNTASSVTGWVQRGFIYELAPKVVTFSASSSSTSLESAYSLSTEAPSPLWVGAEASSGTYILYNGVMFISLPAKTTSIMLYDVGLVSVSRFTMSSKSGGTSVPDYIVCDSVAAPPAAPSNLTASLGAGSIGLTWTAGDTTAETYDIQRKTAFDGTYASAGTSTTTTFTDSTVTTGTTYWYKVTGINTSGTSDISNVVKLTYVEATE